MERIKAVSIEMRKLLYTAFFLILTSTAVEAAQSITLNGSSQYAHRLLPNSSPFTGLGAYRFDMRLPLLRLSHGTNQAVINNDKFALAVVSGGTVLRMTDFGAGGETTQVSLTGLNADILVRVQRDTANSRLTLEVWNSDGSGSPVIRTDPLSGIPSLNIGNTELSFGALNDGSGQFTQAQIAWIEWYASVVSYPSATKPLLTGRAAGDLGSWQFAAESLGRNGLPDAFEQFYLLIRREQLQRLAGCR